MGQNIFMLRIIMMNFGVLGVKNILIAKIAIKQ